MHRKKSDIVLDVAVWSIVTLAVIDLIAFVCVALGVWKP